VLSRPRRSRLGGFFPGETPDGYFDLDHDQRLSAVASMVFARRGLYVSATGIYGSGLTNGAGAEFRVNLGL